jgi:hypothetical protein
MIIPDIVECAVSAGAFQVSLQRCIYDKLIPFAPDAKKHILHYIFSGNIIFQNPEYLIAQHIIKLAVQIFQCFFGIGFYQR